MVFFEYLRVLPRFFLWSLVFFGSLWMHGMERLTFKLLRHERRTPFVREGACKKTGMCCEGLGIELPRSWARKPWLVKLLNGYQSYIHNFEPTGLQGEQMLTYSCRHLSAQRTCSIYPYRPKICREYPAVTFFGHAPVHRGCGFSFSKKSPTSFDRVLDRKKAPSFTL